MKLSWTHTHKERPLNAGCEYFTQLILIQQVSKRWCLYKSKVSMVPSRVHTHQILNGLLWLLKALLGSPNTIQQSLIFPMQDVVQQIFAFNCSVLNGLLWLLKAVRLTKDHPQACWGLSFPKQDAGLQIFAFNNSKFKICPSGYECDSHHKTLWTPVLFPAHLAEEVTDAAFLP